MARVPGNCTGRREYIHTGGTAFRKSLSCAIVLILFAGIQPARGQFGGFNAEFSGGGARAMAMGGAFIALADDATAAEFNPAGLWQLRTPEIAAQVIYSQDERRVGLLGRSIHEDRTVFQNNNDAYWIPSFFSFVHPLPEITLGVSEFTNIYFDRAHTDLPLGAQGDHPGRIHVSERAENYAFGLTAARGIGDQVSVGATVRYNTFRYQFDGGEPGEEGEFDADAISANAGVIWRVNPKVRLGFVYKSPQDLEGDYRGLDIDTELPETFGAGVAVLPNKQLRLLADVDVIRWSEFDPNPDDDFYKDDVWRFHAGAEWYAGQISGTAVLLRGGYFYEESNAFRYRGSFRSIDELVGDADPVHHYSLGFGVARERFQLDFGVDITEDAGIDLIASTVVYF